MIRPKFFDPNVDRVGPIFMGWGVIFRLASDRHGSGHAGAPAWSCSQPAKLMLRFRGGMQYATSCGQLKLRQSTTLDIASIGRSPVGMISTANESSGTDGR